MSRTHAARIAWKDYRRLRGFWFALVAFWTFGLVVTSYLAMLDKTSVPQLYVSHVLVGILIVAMFYRLGWSGTTFSS